MKICIKCGKSKPLTDYYKREGSPDGYHNTCKECKKQSAIEYHKNHRNKIIIRMKKAYYDNREERKILSLDNYYQNKDRKISVMKNYRNKNKEALRNQKREYLRMKRNTDPQYVAKKRLRARLREYLKASGKYKSESNKILLGADWKIVLQYLDSLGYKKGMHIDHIIPLSIFDFDDENHKRIMFNYRNLQPLSPEDNLSKGKSLPENWEGILNYVCEPINIDPKIIIKYIKEKLK